MKLSVFVIALIVLQSLSEEIKSLPGQSGRQKLGSSGYITVDKTSNRNLFYWLVESQSDPAKDPLVIWFTGGPGCSGLIGMLTENGPFKPDGKGGITDREWAWNKKANVIFLEQPAGVGYSQSEKKADQTTDDTKATADSQKFLQEFMRIQPQFKGRKLWIVGESQAGTQITWLAHAIVTMKDSDLFNQLTGVMLGNPVIWCKSGGLNSKKYIVYQFNDFFQHSLVSFTDFAEWSRNDCDKNYASEVCQQLFTQAQNKIGLIQQQLKSKQQSENIRRLSTKQADLDPDDLQQSFCTGTATLQPDLSSDFKKCNPQGTQVAAYLNRADVREAIHATPNHNPFPYPWSACTSHVNQTVSFKPTVDLLRDIFVQKPDLRILYYSGDVDIATVPTPVTQACLYELSDTVRTIKTWAPWTINGWHTGQREEFDKYTFATVKGAGHEVPGYQPNAAQVMQQRFMDGEELDDSAMFGSVAGNSTEAPLKQSTMLKHAINTSDN